MPCGATQDGRVMVERSDRMWSTREGNGKPLQYSCLENPMNNMIREEIVMAKLTDGVGPGRGDVFQWRSSQSSFQLHRMGRNR